MTNNPTTNAEEQIAHTLIEEYYQAVDHYEQLGTNDEVQLSIAAKQCLKKCLQCLNNKDCTKNNYCRYNKTERNKCKHQKNYHQNMQNLR